MRPLVKTLCCSLFLLIHLPALARESIKIKKLASLQPTISVPLSPAAAETLNKEGLDSAEKILAIYMVSNGTTAHIPVAGKYHIENNRLSYVPMYTLGYNLEFEARYEKAGAATVYKRFHTPSHPLSALKARVETMYPLTDTIPYNALYFHVRFNQPMYEDVNAFKSVKVFNDQGKEITNAWRHKSFWLDDGKLLVLMIHPGRVKNGIHYQSPLFDSGRYYTIDVGSGILDANGSPCSGKFSKQYFITGEDREIPKVRIDNLHFPKANTTQPVSLIFSEGVDNASVLAGTTVFDESGNVIPCAIREQLSDSIFNIIPTEKWKKGNYKLSLNGVIYDFAGNRLNRLFEITNAAQIEADKQLTVLPFGVQ